MNGTLGQRNLRDILRDTFTIYGRNFWRFVAIVSIVAVPSAVVGFIVNMLFPIYGEGMTGALSNAIISIPLGLAVFAASILMAGAVIHAVSEQYFNQPVSIGRAYSFAWHRLGAMFWAVVLYVLAISGIFLAAMLAAILISVIVSVTTGGISDWLTAFAIAGPIVLVVAPAAIYLGIIWNFMVQTALLEGCGPTSALSRSASLVKGNWWRVLGIILLLLTIVSIIGIILYMPAMMGTISETTAGFIPYAATEPPNWVIAWTTIGGLIGNIICVPFFTIGETLLYFDLRFRKQGYNLDALANELGLRSISTDTAT